MSLLLFLLRRSPFGVGFKVNPTRFCGAERGVLKKKTRPNTWQAQPVRWCGGVLLIWRLTFHLFFAVGSDTQDQLLVPKSIQLLLSPGQGFSVDR